MSEKKWFIYVHDHHEGPFTVDEILDGIDANRFLKPGFVWAEGMKDWVALTTLPEFARSAPPTPPAAPYAPPVPPSSPPEASNWQVETPVEATGPSFRAPPVPVAEEPVREMPDITKTTDIQVGTLEDRSSSKIIRPAMLGAAAGTRPSTQDQGEKTPIITTRMKPFIYAVIVLFFLVGLQKAGFLRGVEDRLASVLSALPELNDVAPEDYEEFKKVVKAPLSAGPQVSVALSKADPLSPIFYVATNLGDGARFEVYVEGVPHRLLNTLNYGGKLDVVTSKKLAKSAPLRYPDGKPIPRGEYMVYVMEAPVGQPDIVYKALLPLAPIARNLPNQLPQDRRLVFSKKIFFGAKDATYEQRLKEFHDGLVARARNEATELAQTAATLESQALVSITTFDRLKNQPVGPRQKQVWNEMNRTWRPVEAQIVQKYAGMAPEQLKDSFFHANLVSEFLVVEKILSDMHAAEEKLFTTATKAAAVVPEVMSLRAQFDSRKAAWKSAIERALATPANPETGLPVAVKIEGQAGGNGNG